jgi:hypothetical protein
MDWRNPDHPLSYRADQEHLLQFKCWLGHGFANLSPKVVPQKTLLKWRFFEDFGA